ncbi:hypothetical protein B0H14DRAFT_2983969 [Mycena olivaceomarginata]|nr:hypothetical protein B0H14DRAFT_2983969 [Mycena olivaceomarginata]
MLVRINLLSSSILGLMVRLLSPHAIGPRTQHTWSFGACLGSRWPPPCRFHVSYSFASIAGTSMLRVGEAQMSSFKMSQQPTIASIWIPVDSATKAVILAGRTRALL